MDKSTFLTENKKYSRLWQNGYKPANWERLAKALTGRIDPHGKTLMDFGFGKGNALDFFENRGFRVVGVEVSDFAVEAQRLRNREVYHSSLDNLSFLNDNYCNIGFCNDVIEHLPEELVVPSLGEIFRTCSDYLFLSVCPNHSHHLSLDGENLHLTVKPKEWWEEQFSKLGKVEELKFRFSRSLRYSIKLSK